MTTYTITQNGRTAEFESNLTNAEAASALTKVSGKFAKDLAGTGKAWTYKQEAWAHYLVAQAQGTLFNTPAKQPTFTAIVELFTHASSSLQYPRVTFATSAGTVRIQRAGERSRYAGDLMVTDGGGFGRNAFYGRIDQAGAFHPGTAITTNNQRAQAAVVAVLETIASDPAEALGRMGIAQGQCCFCGKDLTDEASTSHGYGPTCAKNWGLPHGVAKIDVSTLKVVAYL